LWRVLLIFATTSVVAKITLGGHVLWRWHEKKPWLPLFCVNKKIRYLKIVCLVFFLLIYCFIILQHVLTNLF